MERPEAIITQDAPIPPSEKREEELSVEDPPTIEEGMPTYEGDRVSTMPQLPTQEVGTEKEAPNRTSSRRWKASERALGSRGKEYLNLNKSFSVVQGEQEEQQYY